MKLRGLLFAVCAPLTACGTSVPVTEVMNYDRCTTAEASVALVSLGDIASLRSSRLLGMTNPPVDTDPALQLIAISRGEQPTPGYGFDLLGASRHGRDIELRLHWRTPEPDAVLAQMITSPCIVVGMETADAARVLVSLDDGTKLGELTFAPGESIDR